VIIILLALDKHLTLQRMDMAKLGRSRFKRTMILAQGDESRAAGSSLSLSLSPSLFQNRQDRIHSLGSVCTARTSTCHN